MTDQNKQQEILKMVVGALQQGAEPESVLKELVKQGLDEKQSVEIVQASMQYLSKQGGSNNNSEISTGLPDYAVGAAAALLANPQVLSAALQAAPAVMNMMGNKKDKPGFGSFQAGGDARWNDEMYDDIMEYNDGDHDTYVTEVEAKKRWWNKRPKKYKLKFAPKEGGNDEVQPSNPQFEPRTSSTPVEEDIPVRTPSFTPDYNPEIVNSSTMGWENREQDSFDKNYNSSSLQNFLNFGANSASDVNSLKQDMSNTDTSNSGLETQMDGGKKKYQFAGSYLQELENPDAAFDINNDMLPTAKSDVDPQTINYQPPPKGTVKGGTPGKNDNKPFDYSESSRSLQKSYKEDSFINFDDTDDYNTLTEREKTSPFNRYSNDLENAEETTEETTEKTTDKTNEEIVEKTKSRDEKATPGNKFGAISEKNYDGNFIINPTNSSFLDILAGIGNVAGGGAGMVKNAVNKRKMKKISKTNSAKQGGEFKPHMMYKPNTGESEYATTHEEHITLGEKGYVHSDELKWGGSSKKDSYGSGGSYEDYAKGGYTVSRSNDRKDKTHKVVRNSDNKTEYYGYPGMGEKDNSKYGKEAFWKRHAKNIKNNPFFKAYAKKVWEEGGEINQPDFIEYGEAMNYASGGNVPTDSSKWSYYKGQAKKKFDVYPSAYANAWAAKQYKKAGGGWRKKEEGGYAEYEQGGSYDNPGFNSLPEYVQNKIKGNAKYGGLPKHQGTSGSSTVGGGVDFSDVTYPEGFEETELQNYSTSDGTAYKDGKKDKDMTAENLEKMNADEPEVPEGESREKYSVSDQVVGGINQIAQGLEGYKAKKQFKENTRKRRDFNNTMNAAPISESQNSVFGSGEYMNANVGNNMFLNSYDYGNLSKLGGLSKFMKGGTSLKKGDEAYMTEEEMKEFIRMGGVVEIIDQKNKGY